MKFGGGAVADGGKIKAVADLIRRYKEEGGKEMVVVTSAIFNVTDILHENATRIAKEGEVERGEGRNKRKSRGDGESFGWNMPLRRIDRKVT